ncbi:MAG TPA: general secretion pathway protein GspC, partial [Deltaproteobacteria bacterium]|nr:general secretion pathway protein GspC [Deltaproteobacteria bacterium]
PKAKPPPKPQPIQKARPVKNQQKAVLKPIAPKDQGPLIIKPTSEANNETPPDDQRIFRFERAYVDEQLANFSQLLNDARVVPTEKDGTPLFMFKFIRKGSIYEKLGLKNEDIILAINGFTVDSVPKALKLFETLQSEREITLKIERGGQATDFQYYID